ncbi:hypothetical protein BJX66DRAFT_306605, partial [Aspergillus keveii]
MRILRPTSSIVQLTPLQLRRLTLQAFYGIKQERAPSSHNSLASIFFISTLLLYTFTPPSSSQPHEVNNMLSPFRHNPPRRRMHPRKRTDTRTGLRAPPRGSDRQYH